MKYLKQQYAVRQDKTKQKTKQNKTAPDGTTPSLGK
jgi:hypothetical protein